MFRTRLVFSQEVIGDPPQLDAFAGLVDQDVLLIPAIRVSTLIWMGVRFKRHEHYETPFRVKNILDSRGAILVVGDVTLDGVIRQLRFLYAGRTAVPTTKLV